MSEFDEIVQRQRELLEAEEWRKEYIPYKYIGCIPCTMKQKNPKNFSIKVMSLILHLIVVNCKRTKWKSGIQIWRRIERSNTCRFL